MKEEFKFFCPPKKVTSLEDRLREICPNSFTRWQKNFKEIKSQINRRYRAAFPDFDAEACDHGKQGVSLLESVMPKELLFSLSSMEIMTLITACYIHDIGLIEDNPPYKYAGHKMHYREGERIINESCSWLDATKEERSVIGKLTRWHNVEEWVLGGKIIEESVSVGNVQVRVNLLIQLIQIADKYHRVIDVIWKEFPSLR